MIKINEAESIKMYNDYGIAEWREKCLLLEDIARITIVDDLEKGIESPLVVLAKLPFPHFVITYLKTFNKNALELKDPSYGYRLYLMDDFEMQYSFQYAKDPSQKRKEIYSKMGTKSNHHYVQERMIDFLHLPLEEIPRLMSAHDRNLTVRKKWVYISQYITAKEAESMHLMGYEFHDSGVYKDCDLEGKLNLLNTAGRIIIARHIGLYGGSRKSLDEISEEIKIPHDTIVKYLDIVFPLMFRSVGEMKHFLKVVPASLEEGKTRMYENKSIKEVDLRTQIHFINGNILSESEKLILSSFSSKQRQGYIAKKYMFDNLDDIFEYMGISKKEIAQPQL